MKFLVIVTLFVFSVFTNASTIPDFPFVTVKESSIREVKPDKAELTFSVISYDKDASVAKSLFNKTTNKIVNIIRSHGLRDKDITSFDVYKNIKRARDKDYNDLAILGYEFSQRFKVKIEDLSIYTDLTEALLVVNNLGNIEGHFDYSKRSHVEAELIIDAANKAKKKAENMALALGVKIDSVFAFNDEGSFSSFFTTFGLSSGTTPSVGLSGPRGTSNIFIPHFIEISKSINVVYKIKI